MKAILSYTRVPLPALRHFARGMEDRGIEVKAVLCHDGAGEPDRARMVWGRATVATHNLDFSTARPSNPDLFASVPADLLAQVLPVAERSIVPHRDVNVSQLVQAVAGEFRRARELVERVQPELGLFWGMPERLLDFFVQAILTADGVQCIFPRSSATGRGMNFSKSRSAPLLTCFDALAPETIQARAKSAVDLDRSDFRIGGGRLHDIPRGQALRRSALSSLTKARVKLSLFQLGESRRAKIGNGVARPTIVYFLHLEPEATTYPANGFRSNQLNNIALLSEWADGRADVLVKEHPVLLERGTTVAHSVRNRNRTLYRAISSMPGVTLLRPKDARSVAARECSIVATVGGSVGWEALTAGIPTLHFGHASYENAEGAFRWESGLSLSEVLECSGDLIAERARVSRRLLAQNILTSSHPDSQLAFAHGLLEAADYLIG